MSESKTSAEAQASAMTTLYFRPEGPMIKHGDDGLGLCLEVSDLNPERHIAFRMSAKELLNFGMICMGTAARLLSEPPR